MMNVEVIEKHRARFMTQFSFIQQSLLLSAKAVSVQDFHTGIDMALEQMKILRQLCEEINSECPEKSVEA